MKVLNFLVIVCMSLCFITCSHNNENQLFVQVPSGMSNIRFVNKLQEDKKLNILYYLYYYNGGGVSTGDINNDGLPDIYFTANSRGNNKLYLNKGNLVFEDITEKAGVAGLSDWCSGVTMADVNNDGYLDIFVSVVSNKFGLKGHNELYINNHNNTFTEKSKVYGLDFSGLTTQAAFFDYDKDGDLDCYVLNQSSHPHANISDTSKRRTYDSISGDILYRNDISQTGRFKDVSKEAGIYQSNLGYGLGLGVADINNDGWDDIYIGNDFHENDYYYINNGNGTFSESGANHFRHYSRFSMGNDIADYNNDGQLDLVTVDMLPPDEKTLKTYGSDENPDIYKVKLEIQGYQNQYSRNCLQRNNGSGSSFTDEALISGMSATDWSWSPLFADFDNDGNKDLFISSGIVKRPVDLDYVRFISSAQMNKSLNRTDEYDQETIKKMPDGSSHPFLFKGDGDKHFKDMSDIWGTGSMKGYFNGSAYADLDNDGDLDLVINTINAPAVLLENKATPRNHTSISFKSDTLNRWGIGAKAYVYANGKMQYQQVMTTRGFQSSSEPRLHFGLDTAKVIDSILVIWPDQQSQVLKKVEINKPIIVEHKNAMVKYDPAVYFPTKQEPYINITSTVPLHWKHQENDFVDFNVQYLIPHGESTRGPKIAVADVNGDGLEDFYACGAKEQPGTLMIQTATGSFTPSNEKLFAIDGVCEDVDATFFDANGDGHLDLYVVSGGNEPRNNAQSLEDRLYMNDGHGNFTKNKHAFSQQYENKSCIAVADIDHDGDQDFFIGNLSSATGYGLPQNSYMYVNNGKGAFSLASNNTIALRSIGMIDAAQFADLNNDGWQDLVITGEWMPIKIFMNNKGTFEMKDLPSSTGLWQTIFITDINGDGNKDILAGNWGYNSKLYAGKNGPLKLYVKDFDKNGSNEQVMAYTIDGKEYPFLAKDELERPLPVLKKAYLTYSEVAGKTVDYIFYDLFKDMTELKAETLASTCFINDGKGAFVSKPLPEEFQLAPVMTFAEAGGKGSYIAGGNFYNVIPFEGRYDGLLPTVFTFDKSKGNIFPGMNISSFDGEVRDIKWVSIKGRGKTMAIARNNKELSFFSTRNK